MSNDMVGMNTDEISRLRDHFRSASGKIQATRLRTTARVGLSRVIWRGPDQRRFEQDIHRVVLPALKAAAAALDAAAEDLARQIGEQQTTSAAGTGAIGTKKIDIGTENQGFPSKSSFHGKNLTAEGQHIAARAELADAFGKDKPLPDGYKRATEEELRDMGIDPKSLKTSSGLNAAVFRGPDGKWFLAFEGTTNNVADYVTNVQGLVSATDQHTEAVILARKLHKATKGNVEFIGHSLGGGLATAASVATGATATTFNAAGLGPENFAIARLARDGMSDFGLRAMTALSQQATSKMLLSVHGSVGLAVSRPVLNLTVQHFADIPVTNYKTSTDPLSLAQDGTLGLIGQKSLGKQVLLPTDTQHAHDMVHVDKAIIEKYGKD
ncbi:MAG: hypothetical protein Q4G46_06210 [Propionibacteriaceae bacterium]|nr:hypothetical protein [Propionibacteriaceae bacterium]